MGPNRFEPIPVPFRPRWAGERARRKGGRSRGTALLVIAALILGLARARAAAPPRAAAGPRISLYAYGPFPSGAEVRLGAVADAPGRPGSGAEADPVVRRAWAKQGFRVEGAGSTTSPPGPDGGLACSARLTEWWETTTRRPQVLAPAGSGAWADLPPERRTRARVGLRIECVRSPPGRTVLQATAAAGPADAPAEVLMADLVSAVIRRWREAAAAPK
ncbi:hypothetical protein [Deferrisoma camini]|uniref:hypothetical protein n=1 Tax=Deferrisoma camini TaxID=1035120 RepID=UPI00046D6E2E|nr:hypothetical protein [Deferrisoma camini]